MVTKMCLCDHTFRLVGSVDEREGGVKGVGERR
jgi:hypothetical protein